MSAGKGVAVGVPAVLAPLSVRTRSTRIPTSANRAIGPRAPTRRLGALVGDLHDDGIAAGVVDEDLEVVVARTLRSRRHPGRGAPPAAVGDPTELLVVLVDERSRMAGHVADRDAGHPVGVAQAVEPARRRMP